MNNWYPCLPQRDRGRTFDDVAHRYDFLNDVFSLYRHHGWRKTMIADLPGGDGGMVLDVCTGTAGSAIALAAKYPRWRVVGLDRSGPMLMKARAKTRGKQRFGHLMFCQADGLAMPFADNSFDAVVNSFGLRNEADYARAIQEMARVLKPTGEMRILEFCLPENGFVRAAYLWYLSRVMPGISSLCGAPAQAYEYLSRTIQGFITPQQVLGLMQKSGLLELGLKQLCGGIVCCYRGIKATREQQAGGDLFRYPASTQGCENALFY